MESIWKNQKGSYRMVMSSQFKNLEPGEIEAVRTMQTKIWSKKSVFDHKFVKPRKHLTILSSYLKLKDATEEAVKTRLEARLNYAKKEPDHYIKLMQGFPQPLDMPEKEHLQTLHRCIQLGEAKMVDRAFGKEETAKAGVAEGYQFMKSLYGPEFTEEMLRLEANRYYTKALRHPQISGMKLDTRPWMPTAFVSESDVLNKQWARDGFGHQWVPKEPGPPLGIFGPTKLKEVVPSIGKQNSNTPVSTSGHVEIRATSQSSNASTYKVPRQASATCPSGPNQSDSTGTIEVLHQGPASCPKILNQSSTASIKKVHCQGPAHHPNGPNQSGTTIPEVTRRALADRSNGPNLPLTGHKRRAEEQLNPTASNKRRIVPSKLGPGQFVATGSFSSHRVNVPPPIEITGISNFAQMRPTWSR